MTLLWSVSLALEVALLVVFAVVVAATLLTERHTPGATISTYPHGPLHGRTRGRHAA